MGIGGRIGGSLGESARVTTPLVGLCYDIETRMSQAKRVLVADDSEAVRTVLVTALTQAGYEVAVAINGNDAYEMGQTGSIDLALLDHLMPGLLGIEVIARWQAEGYQIPVIILSGVDDERTIVDSLDLGAVDFVRKPFRLPELMARIRQRLPD